MANALKKIHSRDVVRWFYIQFAFIFLGLDPYFDVGALNVTVIATSTAILPCSVHFLGEYKVVWSSPKSQILTLQELRIKDDKRISVERPYVQEWNLHIRHVKYSDQGEYTCQINTTPVRIKKVNLIVQVSARIVKHLSTKKDVLANEGDTIRLVCNVTGIPPPEVTWYRIPSDDMTEKERIGPNGEILIIHNVSRYCDDVYECVAFNGVSPAANWKIEVNVQFPPEVQLPNDRIGQWAGKETMLECIITAYPQTSNSWIRNGKALTNTDKYHVQVFERVKQREATLTLRIVHLEKSDFGFYTCLATNPLGDDKEDTEVYELKEKHKGTTRFPSSTSTKHTEPKVIPITSRPQGGNNNNGGQYTPSGQTGPNSGHINIVTRGPNTRGGSTDSHKRPEPDTRARLSLATKTTYAGLFIVVFITVFTSLCVARRT